MVYCKCEILFVPTDGTNSESDKFILLGFFHLVSSGVNQGTSTAMYPCFLSNNSKRTEQLVLVTQTVFEQESCAAQSQLHTLTTQTVLSIQNLSMLDG